MFRFHKEVKIPKFHISLSAEVEFVVRAKSLEEANEFVGHVSGVILKIYNPDDERIEDFDESIAGVEWSIQSAADRRREYREFRRCLAERATGDSG